MSDFFHPMTAQISRKVRQCYCCYYAIEKGERYCKQSGVWEGKYFTSDYHSECWDVLSEDPHFEFSPGDGDPPENARTMKDALASQNNGKDAA